MRLLLDTHILLWWLRADRKLSRAVRDVLVSEESDVAVSGATIWERLIAISQIVAPLTATSLSSETRTSRTARESFLSALSHHRRICVSRRSLITRRHRRDRPEANHRNRVRCGSARACGPACA